MHAVTLRCRRSCVLPASQWLTSSTIRRLRPAGEALPPPPSDADHDNHALEVVMAVVSEREARMPKAKPPSSASSTGDRAEQAAADLLASTLGSSRDRDRDRDRDREREKDRERDRKRDRCGVPWLRACACGLGFVERCCRCCVY